MFILPAVPVAVALASALAAAATDLWKYRIYNALTWPLLASGLVYQSFASGGMGFTVSILGACLGFCPMAALYLVGGLGAGDVKLMAGLGAWLGPGMTAEVLLASWLAAGLYSVAVLAYDAVAPLPAEPIDQQRLDVTSETSDRISSMLASKGRRRRMIPFGLMIFAGLLYTVVFSGRT